MAEICVSNLTFCYEGSFDNIFENVSFTLDTDWKLGFLGRNGKGKTTFLKLLLGQYPYQGSIRTPAAFDYFPYAVSPAQWEECGAEVLEQWKPDCELWAVLCELEKLHVDAEALYRPLQSLSQGECTKVMLAVLFSADHRFLLIDEPTNHLDQDSRESVKNYLRQKKGFLLVSHDRDLLDSCIDHVLVLNRQTIEVQSGNFSRWWENKRRKDIFSESENEKHRKEIAKLKKASEQAGAWAEKGEGKKIGFDPVKEHDRGIGARAFIGSKTKKMQGRRKQLESRMAREIKEKEGLLADIERPVDLKIMPLKHHKEVLIAAKDYGISYPKQEGEQTVFKHFNLELRRGERAFLHGRNGCGKSSFIKAVLACQKGDFNVSENSFLEEGSLTTASGLVISYISQDTSFLRGNIRKFCRERNLEESLFFAVLRQLDMERAQFVKNMEDYSEGQKKKVLIAASLLTQAHLYLWDEPLNYIDVFSRMQIEKLILNYQPTMLLVEHDLRFQETIATKVIEMGR